jgi:fucose 4-O-acetylase-like acetyltransferase
MSKIYLSNSDHLNWVLVAKGIGISLVVIGHFYPESSPAYWVIMKNVIYTFHMPLFFLLSGYLYSHGKYSYKSLIKGKIERLLYPFISVSIAFFLIKSVVGSMVKLEHPVGIGSLFTLLTDPINSYMPLLWFVHALFLIFSAYPIARRALGNYSLMVALLIFNSVFGGDYLVVGKALAYMPFFVAGVILKEDAMISSKLMSQALWYVLVGLIVFSIAVYLSFSEIFPKYLNYCAKFCIGTMGSLLVMVISKIISDRNHSALRGVLYNVGYYSMTIYLLHTLFESTVRIGFLPLFKDYKIHFEVTAVVAVISGIWLPLLLEQKILRRYLFTKKYLLGLS